MKMSRNLLLLLLGTLSALAQEVDADLLKVKAKMDSVQSFEAGIIMDVDISFINMPTKEATISYQRGESVKFNSDDFILIPKRGFDFSLEEFFRHPFITVDRGIEMYQGKSYKYINIIPNSKKADYAIASLLIDTLNYRIVRSEIITKKEGAFTVNMKYDSDSAALPASMTVEFEVEEVKIPLNFMGRDTDIDRKQIRTEGKKTGQIYLQFQNYHVNNL